MVVIALFSLSSCSKHTELNPAATEVPLKTLGGEKFSLSDLSGPKLVNFWSTSCAICLDEMPDLAELHEDYEAHGFTVIAVAMPSDRPDAVVNLSEQRKLPFPVALDIEGDVLAAFASVKGTPTSFLIDADGNLAARYVGRVDFDAVREKLDGLLTIGGHSLHPSEQQLATASVTP